MKKRLMLTSILVILMCVSLIAGATFALFTSEDVVNIAITSGKVEVEANLGDFYYKTFQNPEWTLAEGGETNFSNIGGNAYIDGATLVLDKVVPGNGVKVDVEIKNNSDVAIKYMVKTELSGENTDEIVVNTYCDEDIVNAGWLGLEAGADIKDIAVSVELPVEATIQGVVANVTISVVAVQGDANVWSGEEETSWYDSAESEYVIETAEQLAGFASLVDAGNTFRGKTVKLGASVDLAGVNWEPIGGAVAFKGTFDGQGYTVYNLNVNKEGASEVGFFADTTDGAVKNLRIHNAFVKGYTQVGVVAGNPYTGAYDNITVTGLVKVEGFSYVGGVFGKNVYNDVSNIIVDVEEGSYVYANSVEYDPNSRYADENGNVAYRTYVGGVVGFMGEGGHTVQNATSNIDVYGSTIDVGGITGIAHYGNNFVNCSSSGDVYLFNASEESDLREVGGIAGVWHNGGSDVTFTDCEFTGRVKATFVDEDYDLTETQNIVGASYNSNGTGRLVIDGEIYIANVGAITNDLLLETNNVINLTSGEYTLTNITQGKNLTIVGHGDVVINVVKIGTGGENADFTLDGSNVTFKNITFKTNSSTYIGYARLNATYYDCKFDGTYTLYGNSEFNDCTFNVSGDVYNVWTWGAPSATFNGCTFNSDGKALLLYGQANTQLTVNGCTFNDNGALPDLKAAIEIGNDYNKSYTLTVNSTVVNGYEINDKGINTNTTLWANKNSMSQEVLNVVVDGVDVY